MSGEILTKEEKGVIGKNAFRITIALMAIILYMGAFFTVDSGEVAVVTKFGKVERTATEGLNFKIPFIESYTMYSTRIQDMNDTKASASSKDLQSVITNITVNYRLDGKNAEFIYKNLSGNYVNGIMAPQVSDIFKAVTAKYNAEELVTKREIVKNQIAEAIRINFRKYNIIVDNVSITNFQFSKSFDDAIEAKQVAEQQALTAKNQLARIKVEAEQKIAQAQAEAESLRLQKQEITPEMLQLRSIEVQSKWIDKWNGVMPSTSMMSSGTMPVYPMVNIK